MSIAGLLERDLRAAVGSRITAALSHRRADFEVANRDRSVHSIDGVRLEEVKEVYEPAGRLEFDELPAEVTEMISDAVLARLEDIRTVLPSVNGSDDWLYVEYRPGQYIEPHVDYPHNEVDPGRPKVAGISITLEPAESGGEFFVETFADRAAWHKDGALRLGADMYSGWFRDQARTRWRSSVAAGDAVVYGTHLPHGTEAVLSGVARKLIGFLC